MQVDVAQFETGLVALLGMRFVRASADEVVLSWAVTAELFQPYGIVHGGVYSAAVETVASIGAALWFGDRGRVVGVSNQTDFLRAIRDGEVTATGTPIHRGRSQQLWQVVVTDGDDRLDGTRPGPAAEPDRLIGGRRGQYDRGRPRVCAAT